jgi:hypothetical protein
LLETKANGRPSFAAIDPYQIQDQIFVVEENQGFHDKYETSLERRIWGVKDMRTSWPLQFYDFPVTEHIKTLQEDELAPGPFHHHQMILVEVMPR